MRPGILSALNRNLCIPQQPEKVYVLNPHPRRFPVQTVPPPDTRPVVPALSRCAARDSAAPRSLVERVRRVLLPAGFLVLVALLNLGMLGFERIERARERHLLGRQLAEREQYARSLLEANRHITGVVRVQQALLGRGPSSQDRLVQVVSARRTDKTGI